MMTPAQLESELARARSDPHFVGWAVTRYSLDRRLTRDDVVRLLGVSDDAMRSLELRMAPRPAAFARELARLAKEHGASAYWLRAICRHAAAVGEGRPVEDVAASTGLTPRRVYQIRGVRKPKPRVTEVDRQAIAALLPKHSRRAIAKMTGRSRKVVDDVARAGCPT